MPGSPVLSQPVASLRCYDGEHAAHAHDHAQLLFGLDGWLELELDGHGARVDAGTGLIVPAGVSHAYATRSGARVWVVDSPAGPGLERARRFALPPRWSPTAAGDGLALATGAPRVLQRRRLDPLQLAKALSGRLHEHWPNERLGACFHLSAPQFRARWLAWTGLPPQAWLRDQRLDAAERLLRAGVTLDAAALQVGYRSASALATALRRERGQGARGLRGG